MSVSTHAASPAPARTGDARAAFDGVIIAGIFGTVWALWAASGLDGAASDAVSAVGLVSGVVLVTVAVRRRASALPGRSGLFGSTAYRVLVALELAAFAGGDAGLAATHHEHYLAAFVALVVGAHLLAFGRLFIPSFYAMGAGVVAAGLIGAGVAAGGGGSDRVPAVTGILAAITLFVAGARRLTASASTS